MNFLTSENIFITLQYSGDILEIIFETDICGIFLEYFVNITSWLLKFAKRSTFVVIKSYTFNTKATFPSRTFWKIFSFKMFPKCYLDVPRIATLREHSVNIPGILRAGWDYWWSCNIADKISWQINDSCQGSISSPTKIFKWLLRGSLRKLKVCFHSKIRTPTERAIFVKERVFVMRHILVKPFWMLTFDGMSMCTYAQNLNLQVI